MKKDIIVNQGKVTILIGPERSGKSLLLDHVSGWECDGKMEGNIRLLGHQMNHINCIANSQIRRNFIGYVKQNKKHQNHSMKFLDDATDVIPECYDNLTVEEVIDLFRSTVVHQKLSNHC
eukprot:UN24692